MKRYIVGNTLANTVRTADEQNILGIDVGEPKEIYLALAEELSKAGSTEVVTL